MTRPPHDVRSLARRHTASVIDVLVAVAESSEVAPAARVSAAIVKKNGCQDSCLKAAARGTTLLLAWMTTQVCFRARSHN